MFGYNDGAASGSVLDDNPADPNDEKYVLKYTAATLIPKPAPLARENDWYKTETDDPVIDLGDYKYDWVLAKWGKDAEIYYIGDLTGVIELNRVNFEAKKHGLSHYTLFNRTAVRKPGRPWPCWDWGCWVCGPSPGGFRKHPALACGPSIRNLKQGSRARQPTLV